MKKTIIGLSFLLCMLFMVGTASAQNITWGANTKVHYDFSLATAEGCASCHVTHTADVAKLLWGTYGADTSPNTQTAFCYVCHSGVVSSPYDVENGEISPDAGTTTNTSWAGKFEFDVGVPTVTSKHNVEDTATAVVADLGAASIPGNKLVGAAGTIKGGFKCSSCHDPHAGDKPNDRLLKEQPLPGNAVINGVDFAFNAVDMTVTDYAKDAAGNQALNNWCGQCHGKFDVRGNAAKVMGGDTRYRHPMDVDVDPTGVSIKDYLGNKNAAAVNGKNLLNCLTCHVAHGTTVVAHGGAAWFRDDGNPAPAGATSSSLLLRLDKRGVCYDCHGAATKNLEDLTTFNTTGNE